MIISNILALSTIAVFVIYIVASGHRKLIRRNYLLFILFAFPLIDLNILPASMGGFTVFDFLTYSTFFLLIFSETKAESSPNEILYSVLVFILLILLLIGSLSSEFVFNSLLELIKLSGVVIFIYLLYKECLDDRFFYLKIIRYLKIAGIFSLIFLICQQVFGLKITLYNFAPNVSQLDTMIRYPSFFVDPQQFAQFLAMISFLFLLHVPFEKKVEKYLNKAMFLLILAAIFTTGVRAALLGVATGFLITLLFGKKQKFISIYFTIFFLVISYFFSSYFVLFNRNIDSAAMAGIRMEYWSKAIDIFKQNPYLGIGIGNYQSFVSIHDHTQVWDYFGEIEYISHPESGYLKLLVEYGIFAFIIGTFFLISPLSKSLRILTRQTDHHPTLLFVTSSIFTWLVAFGTVYSFADVRIVVLLIFLISIIITLNRAYDSENFRSTLGLNTFS